MAGLTKRLIDATKPDSKRDIRLWDDNPRGFGIRIKPSGVKSFFVQYRSPVTDQKRRFTIAQYGTLTLEEARTEARKLLGQVAKEGDPMADRKAAKGRARATACTVAELCDDYMRDAREGKVTYRGRPKRGATLDNDEGRIRRHIKPLLGDRLARDVSRDAVEAFYHDIRLGKTAVTEKTRPRGVARVTGGESAARRTAGLLGSIFSYGMKRRIRNDNPVSGLEKSQDKERSRVLAPEEYRSLGEALDDLANSGANQTALGAALALALTGCRRDEIYGLKRSEVDAHGQCLRLGDTKSGQQVRPIGAAALAVLTAAIEDGESPYVFPAARGDGHLRNAKVFQRACERAGLEEVSLHTLRHSFASVANEYGYTEMTVAGLLGHRLRSVTARYTHNVDRALVAAADRISAVIKARMEGREAESARVVELRR